MSANTANCPITITKSVSTHIAKACLGCVYLAILFVNSSTYDVNGLLFRTWVNLHQARHLIEIYMNFHF